MDAQTIDTYNKMAVEYDLETADFWQRFPVTIMHEFINRVKNKKVLDVGSGPGRDGLILKNAGCDITCIDASQAMVDMCKQRGLEAQIADFMQLPFDDGSFDGAWAYTSLLHIPKSSMQDALIEIFRILKPSGVFGLGLIEGEQESYRTSSGVDKPRYFAFYQKGEIESLLKNVGFSVVYFESFKPSSKNYLNYICIKS